jgi:LPS-assembly protein
VMRRAPTPHLTCGGAPACRRQGGGLQRVRALARLLSVALVFTFWVGALSSDAVLAQDPSQKIKEKKITSFPKEKGGMFGPRKKIDQAQPLYLQADQLIYDTRGNRVIAQGNVEVYYNDYILTADQVIYDQSANTLTAEGNAQLKDPNGTITRADRLQTVDDFRDAFAEHLSVITRDDSRIAAENVTRREGNINVYENAKFTACKNDPGQPPLWCIAAGRIIHDQQAATITYQDAQFELFGVPVFYTPYFQHPDPSVKHQSGFLAPTYSQSTTLGTGIEVPYYWSIAPNADLTFHPEYFSKQGVLYQLDWRHRTADGHYDINLAGIDQQDGAEHGWRGSVETKGQFALSSWWRYGWDITLESDDSFRRFYKLDSIFQTDRVNTIYLQGMSERNYFGANLYQFGGLLLNDPFYSDSYAAPVIDYRYINGEPVLGGELSFNAHVRNLQRNSGGQIGTDTTHAVIEANWRRKMIDGAGQVWTPFGALRGDAYSYANAADTNPGLPFGTPIADNTQVLGMATAGVLYSYPFVMHTESASHVIEPTAQIIARPNRVNQAKLPDEDAKSLVFDDTLLFDIDKFSGYDRLETGTRFNAGVQYTFQANNGFYARAVLGQSYHLSGQNAFADPGVDPTGAMNFSPVSGLETDRSDYVTGIYVSPVPGLGFIAQSRFDERDWTLRRQDTLLRGVYGPIQASVGYSYSQFDPTQPLGVIDKEQDVLGALGLRLTDNWSIGGLMRYDIDARERIQDQLQVKYSDECFVLTASYTETFIENANLDLKPDKTFMLRFEFKNLGTLGNKTDPLSHVFGDMNTGPPK